MCFTESSLNYEANHQGLYNGVCGVNPFIWNDYLLSQGINYNSLLGGLMVYKHYLAETKNKKKGHQVHRLIGSVKFTSSTTDCFFDVEEEVSWIAVALVPACNPLSPERRWKRRCPLRLLIHSTKMRFSI